jgi:hypothetical protein
VLIAQNIGHRTLLLSLEPRFKVTLKPLPSLVKLLTILFPEIFEALLVVVFKLLLVINDLISEEVLTEKLDLALDVP